MWGRLGMVTIGVVLFGYIVIYCQTPNTGKTWELTLFLRGNKINEKNSHQNLFAWVCWDLMSTAQLQLGKSKQSRKTETR